MLLIIKNTINLSMKSSNSEFEISKFSIAKSNRFSLKRNKNLFEKLLIKKNLI